MDDLFLSKKEIEILKNINENEPYYSSLSKEDEEVIMLKKLAELGLVKFCPYPEEFWVILDEGKKFLYLKIGGN